MDTATTLRKELANAWIADALGDRSAIRNAYRRETGQSITALGTALQTLAEAGWTLRQVRHCAS